MFEINIYYVVSNFFVHKDKDVDVKRMLMCWDLDGHWGCPQSLDKEGSQMRRMKRGVLGMTPHRLSYLLKLKLQTISFICNCNAATDGAMGLIPSVDNNC